MLASNFSRVYDKFKLSLYERLFTKFNTDSKDALSPSEVICMEIIVALHRPTINEFTKMAQMSPPNAAYRINRLVKKGYIYKRQNKDDKRQYTLIVTKKYKENYGDIFNYVDLVSERIENRFPPEDVDKLNKMLRIIADELMPEMNGFHHVESRLEDKPSAAKAGEELEEEASAAERQTAE
jgi:DNA-binding MarR family transcriptional regulator